MPKKGGGYGNPHKKSSYDSGQSTENTNVKDPTLGGEMKTNLGSNQYMYGKGSKSKHGKGGGN